MGEPLSGVRYDGSGSPTVPDGRQCGAAMRRALNCNVYFEGGVGGVTCWLTVKVRTGLACGSCSLHKPIRADQTVGFTRRVSPSPEETWVRPDGVYEIAIDWVTCRLT